MRAARSVVTLSAMRIRHLLLCGLLAAVLVPAVAHAGYQDPFAPGTNCKAQHLPRHHVKGMKRTPYGVCVSALTRMQAHRKLTARSACRGETRRHVRGLRGTPYSHCVAAGVRMRRHG